MRSELIREVHNSKFADHGGEFKTEERPGADFWWPKMDKDIQEHIKQCESCQTMTRKGAPTEAPITGLPITSGPSQKIHADLFNPLRNSDSRRSRSISTYRRRGILQHCKHSTKYACVERGENTEWYYHWLNV
jgi:hypothetical protein